MKTKRALLLSLMFTPLALLFQPACAQNDSSTLRVVPSTELRILDPIWTTAIVTRNHGYMVYDTLFGTDINGRVQPQMVDSYHVSKDGKSWTFKLRSGLSFHDGSTVTAEDVIASLERWAKRDAMGQRMFAALDKASVVSSNTFKLDFKTPYGAVLESLGKPSSLVPFIMPKRIAVTPADKQISENIGSGPFIFKTDEFRPGEKAVYVKNSAYVARSEQPSGTAGGKNVRVPRVEWVFLKDAQTQVNAIAKGEVDVLEVVPFEHYKSLSENQNLKVAASSSGQILLRFNHLIPPFNDVKVRQAAILAMDQEAVLKTQVGLAEMYKTCISVYPCGSPLATNNGAGFTVKRQLDKAKTLLKASSYTGMPIVLLHATDAALLAKTPPMVAQLLRDAGFTVDLRAMDVSSMMARRAKKEPAEQGGWNAFVTYWGSDDALNPINYPPLTANGEAGWFGWATDSKLETLRQEFASAVDEKERKRIGEAIQVRALEIGAFAPLGEFRQPMAYRKVINGLLTGSTNVYWNVSKQQ